MTGPLHRFARWCPGALGLWLRQRLFPRCFQTCGRKVLFGRFVEFVAPERIRLGEGVVLNNGVLLDAGRAWAGSGIVLEDHVFIGTETRVIARGEGRVTIGAGANFSSRCLVRADVPLTVGRNCLVAAYCEIGEETAAGKAPAETVVEEGCWLGVRAQVAAGVRVGHDAIVGAHALVTGDLPPYGVAVGRPASLLRIR